MNTDDTDASAQKKRIDQLNDEFRRTALEGESQVPGRVLMTRGISGLTLGQQFNIFAKVRDFDDFTPDNDPHGEHDFGSFEAAGGIGKIFWKIDYYADENMQYGSEDPSDPSQSYRVMTVMLAHEY